MQKPCGIAWATATSLPVQCPRIGAKGRPAIANALPRVSSAGHVLDQGSRASKRPFAELETASSSLEAHAEDASLPAPKGTTEVC